MFEKETSPASRFRPNQRNGLPSHGPTPPNWAHFQRHLSWTLHRSHPLPALLARYKWRAAAATLGLAAPPPKRHHPPARYQIKPAATCRH